MLPLRTYPVLHVKSQLVPSQVAVAFAGGEHTMQEGPHELTSVIDLHTPLQFT